MVSLTKLIFFIYHLAENDQNDNDKRLRIKITSQKSNLGPIHEPSREKKKNPEPSRALLTHFQHRSGLRRRPSPPCEGDRDQRWSDSGSVALFPFPFHFHSLFSFVFLLLLLLETKSDGSELLFRFTYQSSDLVLYGGDLLEALGGSSPKQIISLLSVRLGLSSGRRDLLRRWMSGGHRVWGFLPVRVSSDYPTLGLDYSKLFLLKSPYHTRIE
jgi:hypothetical protein